jgi:hypothetical protein
VLHFSFLQFGYDDWLAAQCGCPATEEWRKQMYFAAIESMVTKPETYRDEWKYDHLVLQAHEDFKKYAFNGRINLDKKELDMLMDKRCRTSWSDQCE